MGIHGPRAGAGRPAELAELRRNSPSRKRNYVALVVALAGRILQPLENARLRPTGAVDIIATIGAPWPTAQRPPRP